MMNVMIFFTQLNLQLLNPMIKKIGLEEETESVVEKETVEEV